MLSVPEIVEAIEADFAARNITAKIEFAPWKTTDYSGANLIRVGLGTFALGPPGPPNAPGVRAVDTETNMGARSLFSRGQVMRVRVHGPAPAERAPKRSELAQKATAKLLHDFLSALYRTTHGSLVAGQGDWPQPQQDGQDFLYGAICDVTPTLAIPVLDDWLPLVAVDSANSVTAVYSVDGQGGEELVSETPPP